MVQHIFQNAMDYTISISGGLEDGVICQWRVKREEIDEQPRQLVWNSATNATNISSTSSDLKQQRLKD